MKDMKMSDVFGYNCKSVLAESFGQYLIVNEVDIARFKNSSHTGAVAHVINNYDRLQQENAELREAIEAAMRVKDLWLPFHIVTNEHEGEAIALHRMYNNFEQLLNKND